MKAVRKKPNKVGYGMTKNNFAHGGLVGGSGGGKGRMKKAKMAKKNGYSHGGMTKPMQPAYSGGMTQPPTTSKPHRDNAGKSSGNGYTSNPSKYGKYDK